MEVEGAVCGRLRTASFAEHPKHDEPDSCIAADEKLVAASALDLGEEVREDMIALDRPISLSGQCGRILTLGICVILATTLEQKAYQ